MIAWDDNIWGDEWVTFPHVRPPIGVKPSRNLEVRIGQRRYIENLKQRRHRPEDLNTKAKYSGTSLSRTSDIMYKVLQTRKKHVMPKFYCNGHTNFSSKLAPMWDDPLVWSDFSVSEETNWMQTFYWNVPAKTARKSRDWAGEPQSREILSKGRHLKCYLVFDNTD